MVGRVQAFLIKSIVLGGIVVLALGLMGSIVGNKLVGAGNKLSSQIHAISHFNPGKKFEKELLKAADKEVSPEKKERLIKGIRKIVANYKPIVREALLLFEDDPKK